MAARVAPITRDGSTSPDRVAAPPPAGVHVTVTALSSYVIAMRDGGGGGGTSGTVTRLESGPLRPRVDIPNATYVRTGMTGGGPSSGPSDRGAAAAPGCFLSAGTVTGRHVSSV